jgi:chromosome segregation ATPase
VHVDAERDREWAMTVEALQRTLAELEKRVVALEKGRSESEGRVADMESDLKQIPQLVEVHFNLLRNELRRIDREVKAGFEDSTRRFERLDSKLSDLDREQKQLPRTIAELVVELLDERDRRRGG